MSTTTQIPRRVPPLRSVREAQGLTLRQVAREAKVDVAHLSRVERGEGSLSIDALYRVASVLNLRPLAGLLDQYRTDATEIRVPAVAGNRARATMNDADSRP